MTAANPAPLRNLFVRCPDGQTLCLKDVDVASQSSSAELRRRIVQKWQPAATSFQDTPTDAGSIGLLLVRFLAFAGLVRKLEDELYLTHGGKPLAAVGNSCNTDASLAKYNLRDEATVHAAVRVRGGCFMVSLSILCIIVGGEYLFVMKMGIHSSACRPTSMCLKLRLAGNMNDLDILFIDNDIHPSFSHSPLLFESNFPMGCSHDDVGLYLRRIAHHHPVPGPVPLRPPLLLPVMTEGKAR